MSFTIAGSMARSDLFSGLAEFLAVAQHTSFRAASADLGVTPSAVSQAIRALEARVGLPLFQRTTRKVALTEAGAVLLSQLSPASATILDALEQTRASRSRPAGALRLSVPRIALDLVLWEVIPAFRQAFPEITLDIDVNDVSVDLASNRFDAGIRMGENIERDMVVVRLTEDFRCVIVGSPSYFSSRGRPSSPNDLTAHECIRYRSPSARNVYRWNFSKGKTMYSIEPQGSIIVNDHLSMLELACRDSGLAYTLDLIAQSALKDGRLQETLMQYLPRAPGLFLYFPAGSQAQPKLRAFIDFATQHLRSRKRRAVRQFARS